ncbi:hypothetical protein EDB80DRAFT_291982 [Ilyonectria destructans]|nr:hypothetical protein EDB80DRAFT_291982 [Ilyonectria destructans]
MCIPASRINTLITRIFLIWALSGSSVPAGWSWVGPGRDLEESNFGDTAPSARSECETASVVRRGDSPDGRHDPRFFFQSVDGFFFF